MNYSTSDGASLAYRELGNGAETVLLVHGWMVSGRVWDALLPELGEYRVLVPDLRGTGGSREVARNITLERMALDVAELMEARGRGPVHLVGHSMGGQVAMLAASRFAGRVRSLSLLSPVPPDGLALPAPVAESFRHAGGKREVLDGVLTAACKRLSQGAREALLADALQISPGCVAHGFQAWSEARVVDEACAIPHETLVMATDDPFLPCELLEQKVVQRISAARLTYLPGPGHYPQVETPREAAGELRAFWDSLP